MTNFSPEMSLGGQDGSAALRLESSIGYDCMPVWLKGQIRRETMLRQKYSRLGSLKQFLLKISMQRQLPYELTPKHPGYESSNLAEQLWVLENAKA